MGVGNISSEEFAEKQSMQFDAFHKANIEIDEGGTEAAAATGILVIRSLVRSTLNLSFNCNRPFVFLINDKRSKEVLFAGVYRGPDQ